MSHATVGPSELSKQNPWPGLRAFGENDVDFFFGREREAAELFSLVQRSPVVVLYGQSGLGKTSLLQAGLFPRLKTLDFFPVRVRFDHGDDAPPLAQQITAAVADELVHLQIKGPRPKPNDTLWEYFHRRDVDFWGPRNHLLTPVVVLDQFEEIFTLGHRSEKSTARVAEFQKELESQLEHRPPDSVRERLEANPDEALQYDLKRQGVKFVVTLREDFLADLDPWRERMPSLLPNRFRLERMTGQQALEVVQRAGSDVVDPSVARDIVDFVSTSRLKRSSSALEQRDVDPALLSVVCDGLNYSRISRGKSRITADLLTAEREEIMKDFYERTFEGVDPRVRDWVEDRLLTSSGYRDRAALEDAKKLGLPEADFDVLVNRRLLHREERAGVIWLELTHDSLTDPASRSRAVREQRIQAEAAKQREKAAAEREAQVRSKLRRTQLMAAVCVVLLVVAGLGLYVANKARRETAAANAQTLAANENTIAANKEMLASNKKAIDAAEQSLNSLKMASKMTESMGLNIDDTGIPTATALKNIQEVEKAYNDLSHQATMSELQHVEFLTKAADAYYRVGFIKEGLDESQQALDLLGKVDVKTVSADELQLARADALYSHGDGLRASGRLTAARRNFEDAIKLVTPMQAPDSKQIGIRVNVLSHIGLGRLDHEGWAYESAHTHLRQALDIIKANALASDDVTSWNAIALQEMGASQTEVSQSEPFYNDAANLIKGLAAHDPENVRWKRQLAGLAYQRGTAALNLEKLDEARQLLEQSESISEDLCSRDPLNLDWRLGLVQSRRGLGRMHQESGEWDLAQESLKNAQAGAAELTKAQPTWTQALYEAGAVAFTLGNVLRTKYYEERDAKEKAILLTSAYDLYAESRRWSDKGMSQTPENMEFVRLAGLSIGDEGFVLGRQGAALDPAANGSQEEKNKKETEALNRYKDAFDKLRPIERRAKNEPRSVSDVTNLHMWAGDAYFALDRKQDALSAYKQAAATAQDLVKISPSGDSYNLLSLTYERIAINCWSVNDLDGAAANFRLAEEAIQNALRLQPANTGFHAQEAGIQYQLSQISFKRKDLAEALNAVNLGITTALAGLKSDYSDPSLNSYIKSFKTQLDSIQAALQDGSTAAGASAGQNHVSAEQAKPLLQRIVVLTNNISPQELLNRYPRQVSSKFRPFLPGAWRNLADQERETALATVLSLSKNLKKDQVWGIRKLILGFYDDVALYEAEVCTDTAQVCRDTAKVDADSSKRGVFAFLQNGKKSIALDGTLEPVYAMNRESQLKLDDAVRAAEYMRFWMGTVPAIGGRLNLIDTVSDFNWLPTATPAQREDAEKEIKPLTVEPISDHGWQAIATIQYYGYLRKASIHLSRFGEIQFEGENPVTKLLPINIEVFDNGIRRLRSLEWLGNHVAEVMIAQDEERLKVKPNDAATLKDLPTQYIQLGRRNEAITAEKNWVAYLLRQTKHDDDWSKNIVSAYQVLAWQQLLSRDFEGALASSSEEIKLDHTQLAGEEYRGLALLFLGRTQESEALLLGNGGKKMDLTSTLIWDDAVVSDLATLRKVGIAGADADRIGNLVTRQQDQRNMDQDEQTLRTNPDDEKALRQLPYLYAKARRWADAVAAEKRAVNFFRSKPDSDSTKSTSLLDSFSYLAWYQLFARDFAGSLATTDEARKLDPDFLDTEQDRAYALMFLGRNREAEEIYFGNIGRGMSTNANLLWEASVVADLTSLENQGLTNHELTHVRGLLQRPENERLLGQYLQDLKKNPIDSTALHYLPGVYYNLQRWKEAAAAQRNYVAYLQRQAKHDADWTKSLAIADGSLSWYQLLSGDFAGALASSDEAMKLDSGDLVAVMNHAHALLFLGRAKEAEAIYVANVGKKLNSNQEWHEVVLDDFNSLEKEGITNPEIPRLRTLLERAGYERQLAEYTQKLKANPNDEDALSGISDVYRHLGRAQDAVNAGKTYAQFIERQPNHNADWTTKLSGAYVGLAFHQLFIRDFAGSLASSDEALKLRPKYLIAETNRAHALLFLGRIKAAEAIYLQHRGEKVSANSDQTWDEAILTDFDDLERAGITHPDFARLRKLLQPRPK
jgi:tetratricopeptide (TPR) repeat protein